MRTLDRLASVKLSAWLMGLLATSTLVSFLIPQPGIVGQEVYDSWSADVGFLSRVVEAAGFDHVFSSWLFLGSMALLAVNLTACIVRRIGRRRTGPPMALKAPESADTIEVTNREPGVALAQALPGWRLDAVGDTGWAARSGRVGWNGSMVMHVGLLVLIAAGFVSGLTRFSGVLVLTEGQQIKDAPEAYLTIDDAPSYGTAFTGAEFGLGAMRFTYQGNTVSNVVATMRHANDDRDVAVRVNKPFRAAGKAYLLSETGLAASLGVSRKGQQLAQGVVNLGRRVPEGFADELQVSDTDRLTVTAVPSRDIRPRERATQVFNLVDPVVRLASAETSETLELAPGETGKIGSLEVSLQDVRLWTSFNVRSDKGLPVAYVGFALVLLGMIVRWLDPDVRLGIVLADDGSSARVWYSTRYGTAAAERAVGRIAKSLAEAD